MPADTSRTLLFCAAGSRMADLSWLPNIQEQPSFEVALAYYGVELASPPPGTRYYTQNRDFKVPNFLQLLREHPAALNCDFFIFVDDDIIISVEDLVKWRELALNAGLDVSQPALTRESKTDWPHLHFQPGIPPVDVDQFIEIQCFALTRKALQIALPYFFMVKTGAGLDLALYRLAQRCGLRTGVVQAVQVVHPHRPEGETVRQQFNQFGEFNAQMNGFMEFCLSKSTAFEDVVIASRVLGDTRPSTVRWIGVLRFLGARAMRVVARLFARRRTI